jgi:DNA-binding LacI/PurR family transcriptional regulator
MPVCSVGLQVEGIPSVVVDNEGGMERGVAHLLDAHGCQRIALIAAQSSSSESNKRISGYRKAHEKRHLPVDEQLIYHADFTLKGGVEAVRRLFSSGIKFDAIAAANDYMALGACEVVRAREEGAARRSRSWVR